MRISSLAIFALPSLFLACSASPTPREELGTVASPEVWSSADDPAIFTASLERNLEALPMAGEAEVIPWAGNYWPTYDDSINHRWAGPTTDSPSKKYELAFGGTGVEDAVSAYQGIDSQRSAKVCKVKEDCNTAVGEVCAKRDGKDEGRCMETWFGICHAWAPAAILFPEPKKEVVKNGVTFKVQDLKALASLVHNRTTSKFVSLRCNKNDDLAKITYDADGRPVEGDRECRDTNAGTYHILLANYLGKQRKSFVEDRTFDYQVWNQPLRNYKITSKEVISATDANKLLAIVNKSGKVANGAWAHHGRFPVTAGSTYRVEMTGTGDADLFVKFGSEPTAASYDCRPYANGTAESCTGTVPEGATEMFVSVNGYAATSKFSVDVDTGRSVPAAYALNAAAASLVRIKSEVQYITESAAETDGNLSGQIDRYSNTDRYDYILELDATGAIVGGEWVGASKRAHPDFVWLPTGVSGASVANGKITYAQVKALVDESVAETDGGTPPPPPPPSGETTVSETGTVAKNAWKQYGPYKVAAGTKLTASMTGTNDADIYVRKSAAPTTAAFECRPYAQGSSESCTATGPGDVYVGIRGYAPSSAFALTVKYTPAN